MEDFAGTKLALFVGAQVLVILRDDFSHIAYPAHWDFPGGGRDAPETPEDCILRETREEVGLALVPADLVRVAHYRRPSGLCWFFAAHIPEQARAQIRLGDEGQRWALMRPEDYMAHDLRIPHFADWLGAYLSSISGALGKTPRDLSGGR